MRAKTKLIVIAGPQSSGKTTIMKHLEKKYPHISFIEETNQYTVVDKNHLGGAYVNSQTEAFINDEVIKKIKTVSRVQNIIFIESGIMHCVYLEKFCGERTAEKYLKKYHRAQVGLKPILIFIDTKPNISWQRRMMIYLKRIDKTGITDAKRKKEMMGKYRANIFTLYPLWHKYFHLIPFEKYIRKNSYKRWERFEGEIMDKIKSILVIPA